LDKIGCNCILKNRQTGGFLVEWNNEN